MIQPIRQIAGLILVAAIAWSGSGWARSDKGGTFLAKDLIRDYVIKHVEQVVPKGRFAVQVDLSFRETQKSIPESRFRLPLGSAFVSEEDIPESSESAAILQAISKIHKLEIRVGLPQGAPAEVREFLQASINSGLGLDLKRGDRIDLFELPVGVVEPWAVKPKDEVKAPDTEMLSIWREYGRAGLVFFGLLLIAFFIWRLAVRMASSARDLSSYIRQAPVNSSAAPASEGLREPVPAGEQSVQLSSRAPAANPAIWSKVSADAALAFSLDCLEDERLAGAPAVLVNRLLPAHRTQLLEAQLPPQALMPHSRMGSEISEDEISRAFFHHQGAYRRCAREALSLELARIPLKQVSGFLREASSEEALCTLSLLTPIRKRRLLMSLDPATKLRLAELSLADIAFEHFERVRAEVQAKVQNLRHSCDRPQERVWLEYLAEELLNPSTFAEDELFFKDSRDSQSLNYQSVLRAIEVFASEDWQSFELKELAFAFFGYSENVRSRLMSQFSGKRLEWLQSFIQQCMALDHDFNGPEARHAREKILQRVDDRLRNPDRKQELESRRAA